MKDDKQLYWNPESKSLEEKENDPYEEQRLKKFKKLNQLAQNYKNAVKITTPQRLKFLDKINRNTDYPDNITSVWDSEDVPGEINYSNVYNEPDRRQKGDINFSALVNKGLGKYYREKDFNSFTNNSRSPYIYPQAFNDNIYNSDNDESYYISRVPDQRFKYMGSATRRGISKKLDDLIFGGDFTSDEEKTKIVRALSDAIIEFLPDLIDFDKK